VNAALDPARALAARPRRWLVTGAAGFIGSHLVERLVALGQEVVALDDLSGGTRANLAAAARAARGAGRVEFLVGDVCDGAFVTRAAQGCEVLLHQAGLGSVPRSLQEPERSFAVNAQGTWSVLVAARAAGVRRAVLASSSSVYGDSEHSPQREEELGRPLSPYAAAKRTAELAAEALARSGGPEVVALRYFNVFGPRQPADGPYAAVVVRWAARLLAGEAPELFGTPERARDFTPVASVVEANLRAALVPLDGEPWLVANVGTGRATTLGELAHELFTVVVRHRPDAPRGFVQRPERAGDRASSRADVTRLRARLGLVPPAALAPHLAQLVAALVDSRRGDP